MTCRVGLVLTAALAAACSPRNNGTLLAVEVMTDLNPSEVSRICVTLTPSSGKAGVKCVEQVVGSMGARVGFVPEGDPALAYTVLAQALIGTDNNIVLEQTATGTFSPGEKKVIWMSLLRGCSTVTCPTGQSCRSSICVPQETLAPPQDYTPPGEGPSGAGGKTGSGGGVVTGSGGGVVTGSGGGVVTGSGGKTGSGGSSGSGGKAGSGGTSGSGGAGGACAWASKATTTTGITWSPSCPGYGTIGTYKGYWFPMSDGTAGGGSSTCPSCTATSCTPAPGNAICMSGVAGKVIGTAYGTYWGAALGWNLNEALATGCTAATTVGAADLTGKSISYTVDNPPSAFRIKLDIHNSPNANICLDISSIATKTIAVKDFATDCWTGGVHTPITSAQMAAVKAIQFQIPTNSLADVPFNFCITNLSIQ